MPASPRPAACLSSCLTTTPRSPRVGSNLHSHLLETSPSARSPRSFASGPSPPASTPPAIPTTLCGWPTKRGHGQPARLFARRPVEEVFGASGSSAFYRADVLKRLGGYDSLYGSYYEDVDLAFRLRWAGYRCLFVPSCVIFHDVSATYDHRSPTLQRRMSRNAELLFWANMPVGLLAIAFIPHLVFLTAQALWKLARGKLRPFLQGKLDAASSWAKSAHAAGIAAHWPGVRKTDCTSPSAAASSATPAIILIARPKSPPRPSRQNRALIVVWRGPPSVGRCNSTAKKDLLLGVPPAFASETDTPGRD